MTEVRKWNKERVVTLDSTETILRHIEACVEIRDSKVLPYPNCAERNNINAYIENLEVRSGTK